ncbi:MAG: hypothetical protein C0402_09160 [Thermodesulfovibrio sp.]|nr:hypothetical protein [Thermodesulfovibrio sp.]
MKITIEYCGTCNYRPIAAALALLIEKETGIKPALIHSSLAGALEVKADGILVHSKRTTGGFPDNDEVAAKIRLLAKQAGQEERAAGA